MAFNFVLPSAGGTCRVPGDYLYATFQQASSLGTWGLFRVEGNEGDINPSCKVLAGELETALQAGEGQAPSVASDEG